MFYEIIVELELFELEGGIHETNIYLGFIRLNIEKIGELENKDVTFILLNLIGAGIACFASITYEVSSLYNIRRSMNCYIP